MLNRTPAGLQNLHRFYSVDLIVYCESHPNTPVPMCLDIGFWSKMIQSIRPDVSFKFRQMGGKPNVINIAKKIGDQPNPHSICVMDRDFDDLHLDMLIYSNVVYTYGYSIENEICIVSILAEAIDYSLPGESNLDDIVLVLNPKIEKMLSNIGRIVELDQYFSYYYQSYIPRGAHSYRSLFNISGTHSPAFVDPGRALRRLQQQKQLIQVGRPVGAMPRDRNPARRAYGHMLWWLIFRICRHVLKQHGYRITIVEESFLGVLLGRLGAAMSSPDFALRAYYDGALGGAIDAAL